MKRLFALILVMTVFCLTASAETVFDPTLYTEEELLQIDNLIHLHLSKAEEDTVLYDENGIYVEFKGLYLEKWGDGIGVNVLILNNSGQNLCFTQWDHTVNKATFDWINCYTFWLKDGTMHLTKPDRHWLIDFDDLTDWGFTTIQSIEFNIYVSDEDQKEFCSIPVSLTLDYPIVYPE